MDEKSLMYSLDVMYFVYDNVSGGKIVVSAGDGGGVRISGRPYVQIDCNLDKDMAILLAKAILDTANNQKRLDK